MNIIYLHTHDAGRYVQPYGYDVPTPNIQRFAEQGVLFRQAFCAAPTCSPSRAALLTGQSPHNAGMLGLAHRGFQLDDPTQHLSHYLRGQGYSTALFGVEHESKNWDSQTLSYDHIFRPPGTRVKEVAPAAAAFLADAPKQPFFMSIGFSDTHRAFPEVTPEIEAQARYTRPPVPLPDTPEMRLDMATYRAAAAELDRGVGQVLDALDQHGLSDNTLVILTTDHGIAFPWMKCNLTAHGTGVMLMLRVPGNPGNPTSPTPGRGWAFTSGGGDVCDALVSQIDIFPTLCEMLGTPRPNYLQGHSLWPLLRGETQTIREEVFGEVTYHAAFEPMRSVRTLKHSYIRHFGDRRKPVTANIDGSMSKAALLAAGLAERELPVEALYDLTFDPNEAANVAADPAYRNVLDDLRGRLDRWMRDTGDPLLTTPQPIPYPILVAPPDCDPGSKPVTLYPPVV